MSTRALRKVQREREQREIEKQNLAADENELDTEEEDEEVRSARPKPSAFELLSQMGEGNEDEEEGQSDDQVETENLVASNATTTLKQKPPSRKKNKKKKASKRQSQPVAGTENDDIAAEIDAVTLDDIQKDDSKQLDFGSPSETHESDIPLAVDVHHLQVANEMRRLFGRAAFEVDSEDRQSQPNPAQGEAISLSAAVSGQLSIGGPGLAAMLRRRNIFVQGRDDWPRNTSNGLTMEIDSKKPNGTTVYRFVHTSSYIITQKIFLQFVAMMDPNNLVNLLRHNPYHIATLLQVSEIAKQDRDSATSGELLERALFSFGKALHPSFAANLANGKARLDFRRPENREFFLAAWRYIANLSMRATWRTAFEWTKLLLSLDPYWDHYCIGLVIDRMALRAKQAKEFTDLVHRFTTQWSNLPNIQYSLSLARRMIEGDKPSECEKLLRDAVHRWPWVASRMFQELGIDKIPPSIWGSTPPTERATLHTELYVTFAQDIWKPKDVREFLIKSLSGLPRSLDAEKLSEASPSSNNITLDEARHVLLTDNTTLIALLPRALTAQLKSMSDPLRPPDNIESYELGTGGDEPPPLGDQGPGSASAPPDASNYRSRAQALLETSPWRFVEAVAAIQTVLRELVGEEATNEVFETDQEDRPVNDAALETIGMLPDDAAQSVTQAMRGFHYVLAQQPGMRVEDGVSGASVHITEGGVIRIENFMGVGYAENEQDSNE